MSNQDKTVVSVRDLVVGQLNQDPTGGKYSALVEYGSFEIKAGDFVLVKGRNGYGKSTFLRLFHLQGYHYFEVASGDILFCEEGFPAVSIHHYSNHELSRLNRSISYIEQEEHFFNGGSAYTYIRKACELALEHHKRLTPKQKKERLRDVDRVIEDYFVRYLKPSFKCEYKTFRKKNVRAWSGGQQKMINVLSGIIKAKLCDLRLVVMDEPLNNLDACNKNILNSLIADLRHGEVAIIAITHCQIFDGVNKVLLLEEVREGLRRATLHDRVEPAHTECLEDYR